MEQVQSDAVIPEGTKEVYGVGKWGEPLWAVFTSEEQARAVAADLDGRMEYYEVDPDITGPVRCDPCDEA